MYKVMIIDDEPIIRKGLINVLNWKDFGCQVYGEAGDGEEGIAKIKEIKPDIIITDILMPEIDGLVMIKSIKNDIPNSKIIILTGYRDFEYIQEAIKLGAFDYILKPTKLQSIIEVLERAVKELDRTSVLQSKLKDFEEYYNSSVPILKEKLFYDIIFKINTDINSIIEQIDLYKVKLDNFIMILCEIDENKSHKLSHYESNLYMIGISNIFTQTLSNRYNIEKVGISEREVAFIMQPASNRELNDDELHKQIEEVQRVIKECFNFTVTVAVSTTGSKPLDLIKKSQECMEVLSYKYYLGAESILLYKDIHKTTEESSSTFLDECKNNLIKLIKSGNKENVLNCIEGIGEYIEKLDATKLNLIKQFYINTLQNIYIFIADNKFSVSIENHKSDNEKELYKVLQEDGSKERLHELLISISIITTNKVYELNNKNINSVLQKAIEYIDNNYDKQITLKEVSENTYVSIFYLSRIFKKELNKNFVDYLNELRITKAKQHLCDMKYKNYEVAELVGIPDSRYFSKLFKKYAGITPSEYREQNAKLI